VVLPARPERAFRMLHDATFRARWDALIATIEVLEESADAHFQRLHVKLKPQRVFGWKVAPRDCVVDSSWRREEDGCVRGRAGGQRERAKPGRGWLTRSP
jgi:hypothetical protein